MAESPQNLKDPEPRPSAPVNPNRPAAADLKASEVDKARGAAVGPGVGPGAVPVSHGPVVFGQSTPVTTEPAPVYRGRRPGDETVADRRVGAEYKTGDKRVVGKADGDKRTAFERQEAQTKRLTDEEWDAADREARANRRAAQKEAHQKRLEAERKARDETKDHLWVGFRRVEVLRDADENDLGYVEDEAHSVVRFVDTNTVQVVRDQDISTASPQHVA